MVWSGWPAKAGSDARRPWSWPPEEGAGTVLGGSGRCGSQDAGEDAGEAGNRLRVAGAAGRVELAD